MVKSSFFLFLSPRVNFWCCKSIVCAQIHGALRGSPRLPSSIAAALRAGGEIQMGEYVEESCQRFFGVFSRPKEESPGPHTVLSSWLWAFTC